MLRKILIIAVLATVFSSCSNKTKKVENEAEVIYEQEIIEEKTSEKEELKNTIRDLQDLNTENEKELEKSNSKVTSDFKKFSKNKDFEKVSDTSYSKNQGEPTHRITYLRKNRENIILFKRIAFDVNGSENQTILDTISIKNLDSNFYITIGYCEMANTIPEEIIAIVENTKRDTIQTIVKAWKANSETRKIEGIKNINALICLNEF